VSLSVTREGEECVVRTGAHEYRIRLDPLEPGVLRLTVGGRSLLAHIAGESGRWALHVDGRTLEYEVGPAGIDHRAGSGRESEGLGAPMPGTVTQVLVREGEAVSPGQPLVIVEAMKMEHVVRAPRAGTVTALGVRPGAQVESGAIVAEIGPPGSPADEEKK
jgi:3-methylcrotonyl-CoA carboxylase alpha subunit